MRNGMDKALAALVCAVLIGALGALSWNSEQGAGVLDSGSPRWGNIEGERDKVIYEIEKLHSIWGRHDSGTSHRESSAGNP